MQRKIFKKIKENQHYFPYKVETGKNKTKN